jgi:hypothetical protein
MKLSDASMTGLVMSRISKERYTQIFGRGEEDWGPGGIAIDYRAYEEEARRAVIARFLRYPWAIVELFCFYKPRTALYTYLFAAGYYPYDIDGLFLYTQTISLPEPSIVAEHNLHIRLWGLALIGLALFALCAVGGVGVRAMRRNCGVFAILLLGSYLPGALTYPVLHACNSLITAATTLILCGMVTLLCAALRRFAVRSRAALSWRGAAPVIAKHRPAA